MSPVEPYRKVLLVLSRPDVSRRVLNAACALGERLQAGLEIVCLGDATITAALRAAEAEIAGSGLHCRLIERPDWGAREVVAWANGRACVAALMRVAEAQAGAAAADPWQQLACPLVVMDAADGTNP